MWWSSRNTSVCGRTGLSVPMATGTPAARASRTAWRCASGAPGGASSGALWLVDRVGTSQAPASAMAAAAASSRYVPCSTLRTPARAAASIARAPCAWAITPRPPSRCASSTSAWNSASVICTSCTPRPRASEPEAVTLIQSASARTIRRTTARASSGPLNTGSGIAGSPKKSTGPERMSQWSPMPPVVHTCRSDTSTSGPSIQPRSTAIRTPASAPQASRIVVTPRRSRSARIGTADSTRAERGRP